MTMYPKPIDARHADAMADIRRRLARLENRTAGIDSGWPLAALPAVVDSGYSSGDPMVYLNGSPTLSGPYQHLSGYTPAAGDAVLALPLGTNKTYIILGKLT